MQFGFNIIYHWWGNQFERSLLSFDRDFKGIVRCTIKWSVAAHMGYISKIYLPFGFLLVQVEVNLRNYTLVLRVGPLDFPTLPLCFQNYNNVNYTMYISIFIQSIDSDLFVVNQAGFSTQRSNLECVLFPGDISPSPADRPSATCFGQHQLARNSNLGLMVPITNNTFISLVVIVGIRYLKKA